VIASAIAARLRASPPAAISRAVCSLTAPCVSSVARETPTRSIFDSLL
jgi:hypothetical protein